MVKCYEIDFNPVNFRKMKICILYMYNENK